MKRKTIENIARIFDNNLQTHFMRYILSNQKFKNNMPFFKFLGILSYFFFTSLILYGTNIPARHRMRFLARNFSSRQLFPSFFVALSTALLQVDTVHPELFLNQPPGLLSMAMSAMLSLSYGQSKPISDF